MKGKKNLREDFPLASLGHMSVPGLITATKDNIIARSGTCAHPCGLEAEGWDHKRGGSGGQTKTTLTILNLRHSSLCYFSIETIIFKQHSLIT